MNMTPDLHSAPRHAEAFAGFRAALDQRLAEVLGAASDAPSRLRQASSQAVLSPGKRMRPFILHLVAGRTDSAVLDAGVALEMVHSASLILDDLPCMDDAHLRRGTAATHVTWGEATAILGAVGLLNQSFGILGRVQATDAQRVALVQVLSDAVGWNGLVAGQDYDVNGPEGAGSVDHIDRVNRMKTGVLLIAAAEMGAILAGHADDCRAHLRQFAGDLGQAFQIADDLGDALKSRAEFGKDVGKDAGKDTLVARFGPDMALRRCLDLLLQAQHSLEAAGLDFAPFHWMIGQVFDRDLLIARVAKGAA